MIIIRLWGGLGNQLFQYACGYALAKKNQQKLLLDTRFFTEDFLKKNPHLSKQELNILRLPIEYTDEINKNGELQFISFLQNRTISRIIRIPGKFAVIADRGLKYVKETRLKFLPFIKGMRCDDIYLDGYWQTEQYFMEYKEDLKRQFTYNGISAKAYVDKEGLTQENSVSIHLRMGDYSPRKHLTAHYNYIISLQYYKDAIDNIKTKIDNPVFYIFSNNISLAKELLGCTTNYKYVNEDRVMSDMDEFQIMSMCNHHIISNSTFSWWAAWLSNSEGINIAPDMVFGNESIIPNDWVKLKVLE